MKLVNTCIYKNLFNTLNKLMVNNYKNCDVALKNKNFIITSFNENKIFDHRQECNSKKVLKNMIF